MTRDVELVVCPDVEAAAQAAAERLAEAARAGAAIALSGGSTPRRAFEIAAQLEPSWRRAAAWWGDERCVPPHDARSNYRLAREALLDRLARPPEVHRIRGELGPEEAAAAVLDVVNQRIQGLRFVVNPDKLQHLAGLAAQPQ